MLYMIKPQDRERLDFAVWKKEALRNPRVKAEYDRLQPEYAVIRAVIEARLKKGVTQASLAKKIGTKQSVISRLESGRANPSVLFLKKLAKAMHTSLEIRFAPLP